MRILTLAEFYPPVIGGLEKHAQRLTHELRLQGHEVAVATLSVPGEPDHGNDDGIPVTRIDGWRKALDRFYEEGGRGFHPTAPDPGLQKKLDVIIEDFQPDILHVHGWILYSALTKRHSDEHAVVCTMHDFGLACPKRNYLHMGKSLCSGPGAVKCYRCAIPHYGLVKGVGLTTGLKVSSRMHRHADRFIAVSSAVRNAVVDSGANRDVPVEVIPDFFDPAGASGAIDAPRPDCVPATGDYVLFVGALNEFKGVHLLNDIWKERRPAAPLVLLGNPQADTPAERDLPEGVTMVQNVPHAEVMAAFANCTIAVSPSLGPDACPTAVLEAMALGKPVIGTDIGGIPDLVLDGKTGIIVPPRDRDAFGDAIDQLLAAPSLAGQYGAAGRDHATGFTVEAVARRLDGAFARAIARRRNNGAEPATTRTPQADGSAADRTNDPLTVR
ncbi:MAG: glycosyltransferase involved in cell wall biosynthesis [Candidatus Aldehydirespiratoraceae bacterium]|jgi:glycosyltransferase involved in cell wall biosynthesis